MTHSGHNRQETALNNFSRSGPFHRTPSRHRPDNTGHCHDFDTIQQNLLQHSPDFNPTRQNRLSFPIDPECYGTRLTVGSAWPTCPDHSRSVGLCYECIRLRPDNDRTFPIIADVIRFLHFLCRNAVGSQSGAIIGSV